ncbi:inorganic phosphate transporter [Pseudomonas aeruginosa]|uniref:inorganic phosphate transporter n=1 Tax=Pseudomonas aeruginosa TaxID=287 RepID=UPI00235A2DAC|nr:inorganic phosphate transporter family protein [Pseudomonas aeruginosa]
MTSDVLPADAVASAAGNAHKPHLEQRPGRLTTFVFFAVLATGLLFSAYSLMQDVDDVGSAITTWTPFLLLGVALLIALGFEFVNGFHDTANAVATVIYTHSLPPHFAVVWSGCFNFLGVLLSSGAVAFGIIALLPVELILQVGSSAGFAMVFALLIAAILWNLGTWWLGLPASSSHTLIGSIIGVGVANALMHGRDGTSGVSFAHGSNDGQKGMGLIMLILVGTLPMAYALNRTMPADQAVQFAAVAEVTQQALVKSAPQPAPADPRQVLSDYVRSKQASPELIPALAALTGSIGQEVKGYGAFSRVPAQAMGNVRNDMYLTSEAIRLMDKDDVGRFDADTRGKLQAFKRKIDDATKFIPLWVKIAVAIALGLGTMVGWKRIVVTVGEKIGKTHLTYAQGASAETVAMLTIGAADLYGLPVSTTHVLSSGVAGTMAANGSGLQWKTIRNLLMAWVLTLPAAILLSASLYWLLTRLF